jgi:hypothetical protein
MGIICFLKAWVSKTQDVHYGQLRLRGWWKSTILEDLTKIVVADSVGGGFEDVGCVTGGLINRVYWGTDRFDKTVLGYR